MNTELRRTTGLKRTSTALGAILLLGSLALGACSTADSAGTATRAIGAQSQQAASDSDTIDLVSAAVDLPAATAVSAKGHHKGARSRLLRALHATWVTDGKAGPVTHQAIRGAVTAVSSTSITVKAKDGVSMTFTVGADTAVRYRAAASGGKNRSAAKATASSIGTVKVGEKALVTGVGATAPVAKALVHRPAVPAASKATPAPDATS